MLQTMSVFAELELNLLAERASKRRDSSKSTTWDSKFHKRCLT
ncbi:hypothetical protein AB6818_08045 [Carnobacterium maltaromaticum]